MVIRPVAALISNAFYVFTALVFAVFSAYAEIPFSESLGVLASSKGEFKGKGPFEAFVALNSGLLPRLRFYGLDEAPIGKLLKELFPSPDGSLFTAQARKNHPAYDMVLDAKVFADTFRFLQGKMDEKKLAEEMLTTLEKKLTDNKTKEQNFAQYEKQIEEQKKAIRGFLDTLKDASKEQGESKDKIYPDRIVEIALFAYFIKTYNTREDLNKLGFAFNKKFSDKDEVFSIEDYQKDKKDIEKFFENRDLEKLYLMSVGYEAYEQPFPSPIVYRGDVLYLGKYPFADCMETMLRNLIYFWIMDPVAKEITEKRLIEITKKLDFDTSASKNRFDALMAHLKKHSSLLHSTSEKIHGDFVDTVVGDLNNGKQAQGLNEVLYYKTTKKKNGKYYEIGSFRNTPDSYTHSTPDLDENTPVGEGIYNALNVLATLFPDKILTEKWDDNLAKRAEQATEKLNRLCEIFSTNDHKFDWKLRSGQTLEDKFLTIDFYVAGKPVFYMVITKSHGQQELVQNAQSDWRMRHEDAAKDLPNEFMASLYLRAAPSNKADESHPISRMFHPQINTVDGAISSMRFLLEKTKTISDGIKIKLIDHWVTKSVPLNDAFAQRRISGFLWDYRDELAIKGIRDRVTFLAVTTKKFDDLNKLANYANLTTLELDRTVISSLDGLEKLKKLDKLIFEGPTYNMERVTFTKDIPTLRNLTFLSSGVERSSPSLKELTGLAHLPALEELVLRYAEDLNELQFTEDMKNLKKLDLSSSSISKIEGLKHLSALEALVLVGTKDLKELQFTEDMKNLKTLDLQYSDITKLKGLEHLKALEKPHISGTVGLKFYFPKYLEKDEALQTMLSKFKIEQKDIVWWIPGDIIISFNTFLDDLIGKATAVGKEPTSTDKMLRSLRGIFEKYSELASSEYVGDSFKSIRSRLTSYNFENYLEKYQKNLTSSLEDKNDKIVKICKNKAPKLSLWETTSSSLLKAVTYICQLAESERLKE